MFCPECRAEHRPSFTRCADCDVDLVQELPVGLSGTEKTLRRTWSRRTEVLPKILVSCSERSPWQNPRSLAVSISPWARTVFLILHLSCLAGFQVSLSFRSRLSKENFLLNSKRNALLSCPNHLRVAPGMSAWSCPPAPFNGLGLGASFCNTLLFAGHSEGLIPEWTPVLARPGVGQSQFSHYFGWGCRPATTVLTNC